MLSLDIPTVDISCFRRKNMSPSPTSEESQVLTKIRQACLNKGFFLVTGHGIDRELQTCVFEQAAAFFSLPLEEKLKVDEKLAWGQSHRGYQIVGGEAYQEGKLPDLKEVYSISPNSMYCY